MTRNRFDCERARSRVIRVAGLALHLLEWGEAGRPPLFFLHGGSAHAHWFDRVAAAFADRYHVVALDQRGHGESGWVSPPAYGTEDFAADLVAVMDALGWRRAVLAGHSMGGHNAMAFAAWHPDRVAALAIVDSRPAIPPERLDQMHARGRRGPRLFTTLEGAVAGFRLLPRETVADPALLAHLARAGVVARGGGWMSRFDPASNGARHPVDAWPLLEKIAVPTLVVRGEWSPVLPRAMAEAVRARIPGATLVEIPGAHHHLVLDQPAAFTAALDAFLRSS